MLSHTIVTMQYSVPIRHHSMSAALPASSSSLVMNTRPSQTRVICAINPAIRRRAR